MALSPQQHRIAGFLASGLKAAQVCQIVSVTPSYISQLLATEEFKEAVQAKAAELMGGEATDEDKLISDKYLAMEHKLLGQIEQTMQFAEFTQLVNALKVVGERQEKRAARKAGLVPHNGTTIIQQTVQITVPAHALPEYQVSGQNEVIAVGDRTMAPMSASAVKQLFAAKKQGQTLVNAVAEPAIAVPAQGQIYDSTEF